MAEKEGFSVRTKPAFYKHLWKQKRLWPFCTKGKRTQRDKILLKSNGILAKLEYLRKDFIFGLCSRVLNINFSC